MNMYMNIIYMNIYMNHNKIRCVDHRNRRGNFNDSSLKTCFV